MADELVDIIDESGATLRSALKSKAHEHGWLHKTVIGYLRYGDEWALIRQAEHKQDAGQLVAPVGGHVAAGESVDAALARESEEEIGARNISHELIGVARFQRQVIGRDENHQFYVYEITTDDPIVLNEESVAIERFSRQRLKQELESDPAEFGDAYFFVLEHFYPDYLPKTYKRRWT